MLSGSDLEQLEKRGIDLVTIHEQLENFYKGFPYIKIVKPAIAGDGVIQFDKEEVTKRVNKYKSGDNSLKLIKFVPASGAATRMFKSLFSYLNQSGNKSPDIVTHEFFSNIASFAFYDDLKMTLSGKGEEIEALLEDENYTKILHLFLGEEGMNYANLPKGLLKFHKYHDHSRTALEEHLVEAAKYARSFDGVARIHLTVSPDHRMLFEKYIENILPLYEKVANCRYHIMLTGQMPSTDMISVDMNNIPLRDISGNLLFRPGGHGALLENLNMIDADIVFIKNIDNVVLDRFKETTDTYKGLLAALLLDYRNKIYHFLSEIDTLKGYVNKQLIAGARKFIEEELGFIFPIDFKTNSEEEQIDCLKRKLNRPVRVCGMVKNEGEPGGGPFWVKGNDGSLSLQIVESSQIDMNDPHQLKIFNKSTHFNPVDLVCSIKDYKGEKFDLLKFRDPETGFISIKSVNGKELKAQELPGLWNGSMADWNTVFVEVPLITFNPVKVVNDLLREQHRGDNT